MNLLARELAKKLADREAAIARVRAVCDRIWDDARYAHKYGFLEAVREVRCALDGDGEDVLVTNAIAAMMDGPLIDPDCRDGKHSSCVGGPCECVCHELAALDGESDG